MAAEISPDEKPDYEAKRVERHLEAMETMDARSSTEAVDAPEAAAQQVLAGDPRDIQALLLLARLRLERHDAAGAEEAALRALAADPTLKLAARFAARAAAEQGDCDRTVSHYRTLGRLEPENPRWPLRIVSALDAAGRSGEAARELAVVRKRWPSNPVVLQFMDGTALVESSSDHWRPSEDVASPAPPVRETLLRRAGWNAIVRAAPRDSQLARPLVVDSLERDVVVAGDSGAETGVLVFTGLEDRVGMPLPLFDRYLAALGVTAVYVKDFRRLLFMNGIESLGSSYERTLVALREMVDRLRIRRLRTFGNSGGGRAAIFYGIELGAERILTFGAATGRAPCLMQAHGSESHAIVSRRTLESVAEETLDVRPFLASRRYSAKIDLYYRQDNKSAEANALHLSDLPGVTVHGVAAPRRQSVLVTLASKPDFVHRLAEMLGMPSDTMNGAAPINAR